MYISRIYFTISRTHQFVISGIQCKLTNHCAVMPRALQFITKFWNTNVFGTKMAYLAVMAVYAVCTELDVLRLAFNRCCGKSTTRTSSSSTRSVMTTTVCDDDDGLWCVVVNYRVGRRGSMFGSVCLSVCPEHRLTQKRKIQTVPTWYRSDLGMLEMIPFWGWNACFLSTNFDVTL